MAPISLPLAESYQPASLSERGLDAPFTAPLLAGARIRPMQRSGIELVVPNPAGGRGVYILPWSSARTMCSPTLHDLELYEELRRLPALTPSSVRLAARIVARSGLAGVEAQEAATTAAKADADACRRLAALLWMGLRNASLPGLTREAVAHNVDAISAIYLPLGLPAYADKSRLSRLQASLKALHGEADGWARVNTGEDIAGVASVVARAAASTAVLADRLMTEARDLAADVPALLVLWSRASETLTERIGRAEWVLDGWERIVALWQDARLPAGQRAALLEMAQLVPDLPEEVIGWVGPASAPNLQPMRGCRVISLNESWRTGSASFSLVARNERFRAQLA
jgi:hypothetical protein